tara:strand:- start:466 stop:1089 length:624 start_codon:yes stop_codon:yes gene_type:complete
MQFAGNQTNKKKRSAAAKAQKAKRISAAQLKNKSPKAVVAGKSEGVTKQLSNGSVGTWKNQNGKLVFRITQGASSQYLKSIGRNTGSKVTYPRLSPKAAKIAFNKHYRNKAYKSPKARKAAITRDLCSNNKQVVTDSRYRRSPHRYNYPGLDDGSKCPTGKLNKKRILSPTQKAALLARLPRRQSGGWANYEEAFVIATKPDGTPVN